MLEILKALADPCRLRLTAVLFSGEFTVQELTRIMGMGQSRISRHLKILTEAGLLTVKRQGTWSYFRGNCSNVFFAAIRPAFEQEMEAFSERNHDLVAVAEVLEERHRRSREFFDHHARQWDDLAKSLLPTPEYRPRLLELVPRDTVLLEIGIGTGALLTELATHGAPVIGVDHSPAMLEEARHRIGNQENIELRLGEMNHLPVPDGTVGCVIATMVLHHAADPAPVLGEFRRVLAPGGMLLLADLARHEREAAREQLADQWLGFEEHELAHWLKRAGFNDISVEQIAAVAGQEPVLLIRSYAGSPCNLSSNH